MNKRILGFVLSLILGLVILVGGGESVFAQTEEPLIFPVDQIIIKFKDDANLNQAAQVQANNQMQRLNDVAGATIGYFRPMSGNAHVLRLEKPLSVDQASAMTARLAALPEVEYAEPDYIAYPLESDVIPNDPSYIEQWHYSAPSAGTYGVNAPAAWDITKGVNGVYIAVLDTGITDHADLAGRWIGGYDLISDDWRANDGDERDSNPRDPGDWISADDCYSGSPDRDSTWHGTHVAGTIGAASNNGLGVAGLNWVSKVVPVRVLGKCGNETSDIADGIRWAAGLFVPGVPDNPYPAKVINMSLGGYNPNGCSSTYQSAINAAYAAGSVIVVSAGNETINASNYQPASCDNVITVAATNRDGDRAFYSNYGSTVEISAPGGDSAAGVLSTLNTGTQGPQDDTYTFYKGTSMAAPHVSGVASLMYSLDPLLSPNQVLTIMQSTVTAFPSGSSCNTSLCGSGIVNAAAALLAVPGAMPGTPVLSAISNPFGDGNYSLNWNDVPNADNYRLQEDDNISFSSPKTVNNILSSQYDVNGAAAGTWYYRVQALNTNGAGAWSNTVSTTVKPQPPVLAPITNPGNLDAFSISWSSAAAADGYLLLEADNGSFIGATTKYKGTDTSYAVTGQAGGIWYYRVRAYNAGGDSDWSNAETVTVTFSTLSSPNLLPIVNPNQEPSYSVNWSDVLSATSYMLEESNNPYFVDPVVVYTGAMTETLLADRDGGSLYYRVRAFSTTDGSPWSDSQMTQIVFRNFLPVTLKNYIPPAPWNVIASLDFEGAFPGDWQVYPTTGAYFWGKSNCQTYSGSYSGWVMGGGTAGASCGDYYPDNINTWLYYGPFDLSSAQSAELIFQRWYNTEDEFDKLCWMASIDGINYYGYCASGDSGGWGAEVLDLTNGHPDLPDVTGYSNVWIAFPFGSDDVINFPNGVFIDNVILRSCDGVCEATVMHNAPVIYDDMLKIPNKMQFPGE